MNEQAPRYDAAPDFPGPPRLARTLLRRLCAPQWLEEIEGDLEEQFAAQVKEKSLSRAHLTYWRDVLLLSARPYVRSQQTRHYQQARGPFMLKNYLKITLRQRRRQPLYTAINVLGLAVGMACCLLIGLYVEDELSYDRFHEKSDRLVAIGTDLSWGRSLMTSYPMAPTLETELPDVAQAVRVVRSNPSVVREATQMQGKHRTLLVDAAFFEVFSFPLKPGDPATALNTPDALVITETMARTYFGNEDPMGQTLHLTLQGETHALTIQGVAEDPPEHSTIQFEMVAPLSLLPASQRNDQAWGAYMYRTYALLTHKEAKTTLNEKMAPVLSKHYEGRKRPPTFFALPLPAVYLSDLHRTSSFKGQARYLYIFGSIALFVLLIAAINYINLVTAQATRRAREVGVRKTLGAARGQLMRQFLSEAVLLSGAALLAAVLLTALALPAFNILFDKSLSLDVQQHGGSLLALSAFVLLIGMLAGIYPAFVLARFKPVEVLRGAGTTTHRSGGLLRQGLVVTQFAISLALIVGTGVIYQQLDYVQNKHLGFYGEQVVIAELPNKQAWERREGLKQNVMSHPGIVAASVANGVPGRFGIRLTEKPEMLSPQAQTDQEHITFSPAVVDVDFVETLGIALVAGRDFSVDQPSDETRAYLLNKTAVKQLGWTPEQAVGKPFKLGSNEAPEGEVIGVVEDFHIASLHREIGPVVLQLREDPTWSTSGLLIARLAPDGLREAMAHLARQLEHYAPEAPFEYEFLQDTFDAMYRTEHRLSQVFTSFALLAIFISCLGLFGLTAYTAETRTKEIGIRKVFGATLLNIITLLTKSFLKLILIAFIVAAPLAYVVMHRWLEDFAYRVEISWWIFLLAGLLALAIAWLTVSYQSIKAALANPTKSLRYE